MGWEAETLGGCDSGSSQADEGAINVALRLTGLCAHVCRVAGACNLVPRAIGFSSRFQNIFVSILEECRNNIVRVLPKCTGVEAMAWSPLEK